MDPRRPRRAASMKLMLEQQQLRLDQAAGRAQLPELQSDAIKSTAMESQHEDPSDRLVGPPELPQQFASPSQEPDSSLHGLSIESSTDPEAWAPVQSPYATTQAVQHPEPSRPASFRPQQSSQGPPSWPSAPVDETAGSLNQPPQLRQDYPLPGAASQYYPAYGVTVPRPQSWYEPQDFARPPEPHHSNHAQPHRIPQYMATGSAPPSNMNPQGYTFTGAQGNMPQLLQQSAHLQSAPPRYNFSYEQNAAPQQTAPLYPGAASAVQQPTNLPPPLPQQQPYQQHQQPPYLPPGPQQQHPSNVAAPPTQQPPPSTLPPPLSQQPQSSYNPHKPSQQQPQYGPSQSQPVQNEHPQPKRRFSQEQRAFRPVRPPSSSSGQTFDEKLEDDEAASERKVDPLSRIHIEDGTTRRSFVTPESLRDYLNLYPEADNDRACRVFRYGPACPTPLLMPLFERLDYARYSQYPYGLLGNRAVSDAWGSGGCTCDECMNVRACGQYMLHKNLQYISIQRAPDAEQRFTTPTLQTTNETTTLSFGTCAHEFRLVDWNLQLFRTRSRTSTTTLFANTAVIYQNFDARVKVRSSALDYVFQQLECVLGEWNLLILVCTQFLACFRIEVLEERLETDRTIIRTLTVAAQQWESFRVVLKLQLARVEFLRNVNGDPRWTEDRDDQFGTMLVADNLVQRLEGIELRIMAELVQETDALIQRVTNLISIDEGYRSRDQNDSIRRLTWITFIFLPLLFTSALFSMQVDLLEAAAPWRNYVYASLILMAVILLGWATLRFRRRLMNVVIALLLMIIAIVRLPLERHTSLRDQPAVSTAVDIERQIKQVGDEASTLLTWAASSGNLEAVNTLVDDRSSGGLSGEVKGDALILAIKGGHTEVAQLLLLHKASVMRVDNTYATALHWAAKGGFHGLCQELMRAGGSLASRDEAGATPVDWAMEAGQVVIANSLLTGQKKLGRADTLNLHSIHSAAARGDLEQVKSLAKKLSSLEVRDKDGKTVLMHAIIGGHMDVVVWLLGDKRSNMFAVDKEGTTPLHAAVRCGWFEIAELLIQKGADVRARDTHLYQPIHYVSGGRASRMISLLRRYGSDIAAKGGAEMSLLHISVLRGSIGLPPLRAMITAGCNLYDQDEIGQTALHTAATWGNLTSAKILVEASPDLMGSRDWEGYTPLMLAARAVSADVMKYLLDQGAQHEVFDNQGQSLSDLAVGWGNHEVIAVLRDHGARFTPTEDEDATEKRHPVWELIRAGQGSETLQQLLNSGLDVNYTWKSVSLLQNALEVGNESAVSCLINHYASIHHRDDHGWTALHSAVFGGDIRCLLHVLKASIDVGSEDGQGWTPLDLAIFYGHEDMVEKLDVEDTAREKKFGWPWGEREDNWESFGAAAGAQQDQLEIFEAPGDYG